MDKLFCSYKLVRRCKLFEMLFMWAIFASALIFVTCIHVIFLSN